MEKKVFSIYELEVEGSLIKKVTTSKGIETKFTYSFYEKHQLELDLYENIGEWVKPQPTPRDPKTNYIRVNVETKEVSGNEITQEKILDAIAILKDYAKKQDPEYKQALEDLEEIKKIKENFKTLGIEITQEVIDKEKKAQDIVDSKE